MHASIQAIEFYLPPHTLTTEDLSNLFPEWSMEKMEKKTGIKVRHIAGKSECASDLAFMAATRLFESGECEPKEIDFLLLCTQSPDYALPTTACLLQDRLSIPTKVGSFDFNLGCSGYVYGLGIAEGLIRSEQARRVLLLTAETYSKYLDERDKGSRVLFGDGATATLISAVDSSLPLFGPFVYGTDGSGGRDLIVLNSGARSTCDRIDQSNQLRHSDSRKFLTMDGNRVFQFAVSMVPNAISDLLNKSGMSIQDIDLFVLHQANSTILNEISTILGIPASKMEVALENCGNTVSSTIPIALKQAETQGRLREGSVLLLAGFGVGYSWSATILRWHSHAAA